MATDQQKIWFCGFYEGEGSISNDKSNNNRLRLSISQNDPTPLMLAQDLWGGSLCQRIRKSPASEKMCTGYEWRLCHRDSLKFLADIKPYMIIPYKIDQLDRTIQQAKIGHKGEYKCSYCGKIYANPAGRRRHELKEHINNDALYECPLCCRTYKSTDSLHRHHRINHNSDASQVV